MCGRNKQIAELLLFGITCCFAVFLCIFRICFITGVYYCIKDIVSLIFRFVNKMNVTIQIHC